jgi:predicted PurR-regulated permease PerM
VTVPFDHPPPAGLTESAAWRVASRTVVFVIGLLVLLWVVIQLRAVLVQVLLAVILAAGMAPLVDRLTLSEDAKRWRWRPPRALVVLVLYIILLALLSLLGMLVFPPLFREVEELARHTPEYAIELQAWLESAPSTYPWLPSDLAQTVAQQVRGLTGQLFGLISQALVVFRVALGVLSGTLNGIFTLILALYITADSRRILNYLLAFLPRARREQAERVASHIGLRLGGWVRGQLLLSAIIGLLTLVGLSVIGVRYAVLLALIAAIGEAVPMVGPIFSAIPAVIIAFTHSPQQGFMTLGLYVLIQQLENNLIVPKVMGRAVELHALAVMLALLAGSELMGVTGAILSVPVTAALSVVVDELRRERLEHESAAPVARGGGLGEGITHPDATPEPSRPS